MALLLILSVFRNLRWSHSAAHSINSTQFLDAHTNSPLTARNPSTQILGIIGLGQIGYTIARKVHAAFGMKILYHDIIRKEQRVEKEVGAEYVSSLEEMLGRVDCVVVATPFAGRVLMDREMFGKMKRGSRFVNVARGGLVDEEALVEAVESGRLSGVGMDVHANEPFVHPRLAGNSRVMMMSHNAGGTVDTHVGFERLAMENIEGFLVRGRALTPVNAHLIRGSKL